MLTQLPSQKHAKRFGAPKRFARVILLLLLACCLCFVSASSPPKRIRALYGRLDPKSVSQHLALYQLYPHSTEGQQALRKAWQLLSAQPSATRGPVSSLPLPTQGIQALVAIVNKHPLDAPLKLSENELAIVDRLASSLPNRYLKGYRAPNEAAVLALPPHEIDLARGLFLSQMGDDPTALQSVRNYEAMLDLMALQIRARLPMPADPETKVRELNRFVFEEMNFRFPPHSVYAKDIDLYTFLPSVLDSRRGVCLGVSVLYLCLAQRLEVPLEIVTPPGHIYVRYRTKDKEINIETTMRGVHVDSSEYLGIDTRKLQERDMRETIGMTHVNQAGVYLQSGQYDKAIVAYNKAAPYLTTDLHHTQLLGLTYALNGDDARARPLLEKVRNHLPDESVSQDTLIEDYLTGRTDAQGLKTIFMEVDEKIESLQAKKNALETHLKDFPNFRSGWLQLGTTLMQMHRLGEGLECLEHYHSLHPTNVNAEYFLSVVYAERLNYNKAWEHLHNTEALLAARNHNPKAIKTFRRQLALRNPQ